MINWNALTKRVGGKSGGKLIVAEMDAVDGGMVCFYTEMELKVFGAGDDEVVIFAGDGGGAGLDAGDDGAEVP